MADEAPAAPATVPYDQVVAARDAGYTDTQIADHIASITGQNIAAARKAGYDDAAIVDYLSPQPKPTPPAPPPSGIAKGMLKAAGQETVESGAETVKGVGAVAKMVGGTEARESSAQIKLFQQLDDGADFRDLMRAAPTDVDRTALRAYQIATPEEKASIKQGVINAVAAPENQVQLTGEHLMKAGEKISEAGKATFPLTPEEEQRPTVIATKMVAGLTKYIGAAVAGGMPAVIGVAGVDAFGKTYDDARTAGRTDDEAMGDALISGMVNGGLMAVPIGQATKIFDAIPVALKGDFVKALAEAGKSGLTLTAFSQVQQVADNVIAQNTYDPARKPLEGVGEHIPETFVAGAVLPLVGAAATRAFRGRTPAETAKPVLDAPSVDAAIDTAKREVGAPVDTAALAAEAQASGDVAQQQQAKLNQLFSGLNDGEVQKVGDGYVYAKGEDQIPLKVWDANAPPEVSAPAGQPLTTISPDLAAAQREHYAQLGVDVVHFENDPRIGFDGAVDPKNPNTLFLSNNPQRNVAQVGAHELTHTFENIVLPDGTNLGDLLHRQVASGVTPEGLEYAANTFGSTAPKRADFPAGPEGDRQLGDAYVRHLVTELAADIGGEAPKFQTFIPKVVDAVQQRYGADAAKGVVQKLIEGIRGAMQTMREFFVGERGPTETASQHWVTNLDEIHNTLAKMYAERFGTRAEKENVALVAMRDQAQRDRFVTTGREPAKAPGGPVTPYEDASQKAATYKRWLRELEAQGGSDADIAKVRTAFFAERQNMAKALAAAPAEQVGGNGPQPRLEAPPLVTPAPGRPVTPTPENVYRPETHGAPAGSAPTAARSGFDHRVAHEIEQIWADKSIMGKTQRGVTRNENFARDLARERVMREEAAPQVERAIKEDGIPEDRIPTIARYFRPADGESMEAAFNKAVDRYLTIEEAKASQASIEPDVENYDMLGEEARRADPVLKEVFDRLDEHYAGEHKGEIPGDEDIPFGTAETAPAPSAGKEAARGEGGRPEGQEAGGKPGVGREAPAQEETREPVAASGAERPAEPQQAVEAPKVEPKPEAPPAAKPATSERPVEHPVLPPAPEARPEPKPESPHAREAAVDHRFADAFADMLDRGNDRTKISAADVQRLAEREFGGTLGSGAFSRDRLYDAMELGVNRYIQRHPERFSAAVDAETAKRVAAELAQIKESLPTQTVRAGEKDAYQQFSTPPDYAYAANWIANLRASDHVLEPSAGVGGLIVHAMTSGVRETTVNELSDKRRGMISALEPSRITGEDAAQLHNILPDDVRPTVVVMNPPFSRAAERMGGKMVADEGAKHIEQALQRLEPGGRLVAIVGDGMKPEGTVSPGGQRQGTGRAFRDWWNKIGKEYDVLANVGVDREIYTKYGTSFPTRFLVIDKRPPSGRELVTGQVRDAAGLIEHLKEVHDERSTSEQTAGEPGRAAVADGREDGSRRNGELFGATGDVGIREGRREPAGAAVGEPAGAARGGAGGEPADEVRAGERGARDEVVSEQSESVDRGAGAEPGAAAAGRGESERGFADSGGDGLRPDRSGQRDEPGVTPAPEDVLATEAAVAAPTAPSAEGVSEAIYENYKPQRITIAGAKPHPGALVQSAAMGSVLPPKTDYKPRIPASLVKNGALSDAQLEAIVYAGHAHSDVMANGKRRGFFIGDGTGVGKGREIAGILLDNKQQGRTKHVWISEKGALLNDAKRDWNGLGQPASEIISHNKTKAGDDITAKSGILFTTYDTLKSAEQTKANGEKVRGQERVDQIIKWVGKDFDGVIAFDESHNMGNSTDEKGSRGVKKAAQKALAAVRLQEELPNARIVYVSATGATEVGNLAYADRLGLWGEGTPFPNRKDFVGKVSEGGMAAMELVARDMKALGHYIARSLSYDGVDYDRVQHVLSKDQRVVYDKLAEGWQTVLQNFEKAMELTGVTDGGKTQNSKAKSAMLSAFWGGHQRFFNQIITSMQMPSVIKGVEADIKAKRHAVLQLVNTMEAAQDRAVEKAKANEGDLEDLDMTPRDQLMQLVEKSFPVQQMEEYMDDKGNVRTRGAVDSNNNPVLNKAAVAMREKLLDELGSIRVPDGPLEMILNHFGKDNVAEITGRSQRVVRDETGKTVLEKRPASSAVSDASDFQAGKKKILVFSEAGGTGRSYHAAIGTESAGARRSHYLVQGGWRADKAVQGFGRTHRTSQESAPIFHLVTTDLQGQMRFISSIARRLGQLGALTKGERRTGDQGMFGMRDNLESAEAKSGLGQFFKDVMGGKVEGVTTDTLERGMGLKLRDAEGVTLSKMPDMPQFLNRVLSLKIEDQNRVFNAFSERMDQAIDRASASGTLDTGVETYKADKITKQSEQTVFTDPRSGAETQHVHLLAHTRNHPVDFDATLAGRNKTNGKKPDGFVQNNRSERVFAVTSAGDRTDENGTVTSQVRLTSPVDYQMVDRDKVGRDNFTKLTEDQARPLWDKQVEATPEFRKSDLHLITGAVLPIWDRLGGNPKIYRLQTDEGERMLGRVIPSSLVDETLKRLGAEGLKVDAKPGDVAQRVLGGDVARLANDWTIKRSRVAGEDRLELVGPDFNHKAELERNGVFSERIQYNTRYFVPTEPAAAAKAIEGITKTRPVTSLSEPGAKFSPKRDLHANPEREYTPDQERMLVRQRATETPTWGDWWNKVSAGGVGAALGRAGTRLAIETVDRYAALKKRDPEGYQFMRQAHSSEGGKVVWLTEGTLAINGKAYDLGVRNGGARALLQPLKKEVHDFFFWVASHRAEELAAEDREHRFTPEDIKAGKTLNRGELDYDYTLANGKTTRSREAAYADSLAKLNVLNQNILDIAVARGLLTRDVADVLMKNQFYVPFFRERADGTAEFVGPMATSSTGMAKQTFGKKLTGGTEKLNSDLVENWVNNASHIIDAAAKNAAAHQTLETAVDHGIATKLTEQEFTHLSDKQQKAESTWVMVDGKKQYYHVEDPLLFKAVGTLAALSDPFYALSAARIARRTLQVGVTHNPIFAARNLARDSLQALAVTPQSANVLKTITNGFRESDALGSLNNMARAAAGRDLIRSNLSDDAVRLLAGGGTMKIASLSDTGVNKVKIGSLLDSPEKLGGFLDGLGKAMHAYSQAVGKGEEFNRIALYKNLREQGVPHDIASFSAQDLTDFSLGGANVIVRYIRETVPFTNSRAQGLYKVARALSGSDAAMFKALDAGAAAPSAKSAAAVTLMRTAGTLVGLTVATMALDAIYADDPEYQQRNEYDRQNYWFFRVGEERFRIPMPFEVGALSRIAADTALAFFDDRMTVNRYASSVWQQMQNNLGFGFVPQVVSPLIDVAWTGKSGTGQAIEPRGMENLRPEERYTVNNTMAARGASSAINGILRALPGMGASQGPSPMQIDYLVKAYGGWLGQAGLGTADTAIRSFTSEPARPAGDTWADVTQGLVETSPRSASRYVDALYAQAKNVEQAFATYKDILSRGQAAEAQEFFQANKDLIQKYGLTQGIVRAEGQLNKQIRMVTNNPDPNVTPEQKRIQIMQLQGVRNRLAEQAMTTR